jgi:hypothetical protein
LLEAIIKDVMRNQTGLVSALDLASDEDDLEAAKEFLEVLDGAHSTTAASMVSLAEYSESVRGLEKQNASRTLRIACRRLANALDGVLKALRRFDSGSGQIRGSLRQKIAAAEKAPQG